MDRRGRGKRPRDDDVDRAASEPFSPASFDWEAHADALARAFHTSADAYPRGTPEATELRDFVPKLASFRARAPPPREPTPARASLARALGIPAHHDPAHKVNARVSVAPPASLSRAVRGRLPPAALDAYASMLPVYEDFRQKRQLAKIVDMAKAKANLPIAAEMDAIVASVRAHPVTLVAGDTGCGKSTQVPQYLIRAGFERVACTQPRRVAAVALARRVAREMLTERGDDVAHQIRFDSTVSRATKCVFLTEGTLLRKLADDPDLVDSHDVVVVDEAHERRADVDLLLGLLRGVLARRPTFRLVIMSATMNLELFARYFGGCPAVEVPGRTFPVETVYLPPPKPPRDDDRGTGRATGRGRGAGRGADRLDPQPYLSLLQRIDAKYPRDQRGDLLIFLPGAAEIASVADRIRTYASSDPSRPWIVLPLHGALGAAEQDRVFDAAPDGARKVILSTNVAETSVTVDGVRFVADSGRHKEMRSAGRGFSGGGTLTEGWISRASADQRRGRAGRVGPGVCFRMYSRETYESTFDASSSPEISRIDLDGLILRVKSIAGDDVDPRRFPWLEPPPSEAIERATWRLRQHGALRADERLTPLGAFLASLPVDAAVGKLLTLGSVLGLAGPIATIAAALSTRAPFARGFGAGADAAERSARAPFESPHGDPFTRLVAFARWARARDDPRVDARRWCRRAGLEEHRLIETAKLQRQFRDVVRASGLLGIAKTNDSESEEDRRFVAGAGAGTRRGDGSNARRAKRRLRHLQRRRERERGSRVLEVDANGDVVDESSEDEDDADRDADRDAAEAAAGTGDGTGTGENRASRVRRDGGRDDRRRSDAAADEAIRRLDLAANVDLRAARRDAGDDGELSPRDVDLAKAILAMSMYPKAALPDARNASLRESDARFHAKDARDATLHPTSTLAHPDHAPVVGEAVLFAESLETSRTFLCGCARVPAHALLLSASRVECDATGDRALVDRWCLLTAKTPGGGEALLLAASRLRLATRALLRRRLRRTPHGARRATEADRDVPPRGLADAVAAAKFPVQGAAVIAEETARAAEDDSGDDDSAADDADADDARAAERLASDLAAFAGWPALYDAEALTESERARRAPLADASSASDEPPGVAVAPWLRWGALRGDAAYTDALEARQPKETETETETETSSPRASTSASVRRRWTCPRCDASVLASYRDMDAHRATCGVAVAADDPRALPSGFGKRGREGVPVGADETRSAPVRDDAGNATGTGAWAGAGTGTRSGSVPGLSRLAASDASSDSSRPFSCETCGVSFDATPLEALRHRRACVGSNRADAARRRKTGG